MLRTLFVLWLTASFLLATDLLSAATGSAKGFDGPAELPRLYVRSALADTPASGQVRLVREGDSLQAALDSAKCGDTLKLQAGATFRGSFRLPAKACDDAHWIILRTSAPDESLPAEGTRVSPCYAGVSSLPGRPDFHCVSPRNVLAKIELDGKGDSAPIEFATGANHYRLIGLEVTRAQPDVHLRNLIQPEPEATAHHLVFDRLWLHGTAHDETKGGLHLSGTTYVALVDSYLNDFHCIAGEGSCTDAQAVNGGTGKLPGGPYKIVNNFLEASGENILFGGAAATTTPADIEIRGNHFFKPMNWKPGQADFVGSATGKPFVVKNHFELKNGQRVLFEGNVLENVWGGFSQNGFSILLTPKSQNGNCPGCRVTDVTIRYCRISHVGSGVVVGNTLSTKAKGASSEGGRYSIHDITIYDIDAIAYKGFGSFGLVESVMPPLKDVNIDHVTALPQRVLISIHSFTDQLKISNFNVTNSIFMATPRQIGNAGGGKRNCAFGAKRAGPAGAWDNCFAASTFTHNLIIGGSGDWPAGNIVVKDENAAGLLVPREGEAGGYRLCREKGGASACSRVSPAVGAGSDGKDLGADLEAVRKATEGVE